MSKEVDVKLNDLFKVCKEGDEGDCMYIIFKGAVINNLFILRLMWFWV